MLLWNLWTIKPPSFLPSDVTALLNNLLMVSWCDCHCHKHLAVSRLPRNQFYQPYLSYIPFLPTQMPPPPSLMHINSNTVSVHPFSSHWKQTLSLYHYISILVPELTSTSFLVEMHSACTGRLVVIMIYQHVVTTYMHPRGQRSLILIQRLNPYRLLYLVQGLILFSIRLFIQNLYSKEHGTRGQFSTTLYGEYSTTNRMRIHDVLFSIQSMSWFR